MQSVVRNKIPKTREGFDGRETGSEGGPAWADEFSYFPFGGTMLSYDFPRGQRITGPRNPGNGPSYHLIEMGTALQKHSLQEDAKASHKNVRD